MAHCVENMCTKNSWSHSR